VVVIFEGTRSKSDERGAVASGGVDWVFSGSSSLAGGVVFPATLHGVTFLSFRRWPLIPASANGGRVFYKISLVGQIGDNPIVQAPSGRIIPNCHEWGATGKREAGRTNAGGKLKLPRVPN